MEQPLQALWPPVCIYPALSPCLCVDVHVWVYTNICIHVCVLTKMTGSAFQAAAFGI